MGRALDTPSPLTPKPANPLSHNSGAPLARLEGSPSSHIQARQAPVCRRADTLTIALTLTITLTLTLNLTLTLIAQIRLQMAALGWPIWGDTRCALGPPGNASGVWWVSNIQAHQISSLGHQVRP